MAKDKRELMNPQSGFFQGIVQQGKLILRLMADNKVNFLLKLLPVAAAAYVISPVDILPGLVLPVVGVLDDAAVLWMGTTLFVSLCPDDIVAKHMESLRKVIHGTWRNAPQDNTPEIIDASSTDVMSIEAPVDETGA